MEAAPYAFVELDPPLTGTSWVTWSVAAFFGLFVASIIALNQVMSAVGPVESIAALGASAVGAGAIGWALRRRRRNAPVARNRRAARELLVRAMEGRLAETVTDDEICEAVLRANGANSATLGAFRFKELEWIEGVIGRPLPRLWIVNDPASHTRLRGVDRKAKPGQVNIHKGGRTPKWNAAQDVSGAQGVGMIFGFLLGGGAGMALASMLGRRGLGLTRKSQRKKLAIETDDGRVAAVRRGRRGGERETHELDCARALVVVSGEQLRLNGNLAATGSVVWRFFQPGRPGLIEAFDPEAGSLPWWPAYAAAMGELEPFRMGQRFSEHAERERAA